MKISVYNNNGDAENWWENIWNFYKNDYNNSPLNWHDYLNTILNNKGQVCERASCIYNIEFELEEDGIAFLLKWS